MTQATTWSLPLVGPSNPTDYSQRIDDSFDALLSGHSGSARPSYAVAGTLWQDTSVAGKTTIYFYDGATDILIQTVDTANDRVAYAPQPAVTIASAGTTDIGAATSETVVVSGTTTITSLGTAAAGTVRRVRFSGVLILTHNATSLILLGGANITTAAGDVAEFVSEGSGNWRCTSYQRSRGFSAWEQIGDVVDLTGLSNKNWTDLSAFCHLRLTLSCTLSSSAAIQARVSTNNGSSFISGGSDYSNAYMVQSNTAIVGDDVSAGSALTITTAAVGAGSINEAIFKIGSFNKARAAGYSCHNECDISSVYRSEKTYGFTNGTSARNAFQILPSSGTFASGYAVLEGLRG